MTTVEKMSLYDFAKMTLGGREPLSVVLIDSKKNEEISRIEYFGIGDSLESIKFSPDDYFDNTLSFSTTQSNHITELKFPGAV
jgi:hypothetical protein